MVLRCRRTIESRPSRVRHGEMFYALPRVKVTNRSEEALIIQFLSDRKLFGAAYREVQPDYFDAMPYGSGAFVGPLVRTTDVVASARRPGDIDLLIIPYEADQLVLDRVLVIEVKAVRAKFAQQGKSPNEFGFSQASALLELGFPYVAVAHLIISDGSPRESWQTMIKAEVLENDEIKILGPELIDPLPNTLTDRVFGRLVKSCPSNEIGLISAYVCSKLFGTDSEEGHTIISPNARPALLNKMAKISTLKSIASYFDKNAHWFLDNPKFDPAL